MLFRFLILLLPGVIIFASLAWTEERQAEPPQKQALVPRDALPDIGSPYSRYVGFCFSEDPLPGRNATRGDLLLYGRPRPGKILIRGALYRLRGPMGDGDTVLTIRGGRGFRKIRSLPLESSERWRKVLFRSRMPRITRWSSPGKFSFQFGESILDNSCSLRFRF